MQNIAHCLSFKKTFSSQYGLKWTQRKSALTENKLLSYIQNNTSASTSAWLRKVDFSALKIGMYTIAIRTNITGTCPVYSGLTLALILRWTGNVNFVVIFV